MDDLTRFEDLWRKSEEEPLNEAERSEFERLGRQYPEVGHRFLSESLSLNLLRSCSVEEVEPSDRFTTNTIRLVQTNQKMSSLSYWLPVLCSAGVAAAALFAILQMISRPDTLPQFRVPKTEARNVRQLNPLDAPVRRG